MVKIHIEHFFSDVTPTQFFGMLLSPEFDALLKPIMGLKERTLLDRTDDGKVVRRRIKVVPGFPVPKVLQTAFAGKELEYLEESAFHRDTLVMDWSSKPNMFTDRVNASGQVVVKQEGTGVRRTITGNIDVDVFGIGRLMEAAVRENVERSYEKASDLTRQWIREGKHKNFTVA